MTLGKILQRNSQQYPDKVSLASFDRSITFGQLNEMVNKLANGLLNLGLDKGDRVAVLLPKVPEVIISFLAVARAGGIIFPVNFKLKSHDLKSIFNYVSPAVVISEYGFAPLLEKHLLPQHPFAKIIYLGGKRGRKEGYYIDDIINDESDEMPDMRIKESDVVYLNYTSGTTGLPKGVMTTHANIIWNSVAAIDTFNLNHNDVHMSMFQVYAHPHELFARGLYLGGTSILVDSIFPKTVARAVTEFKVTALMAVPYLFKSLIPLAANKEYDFSSLGIIEAGGMHSSPELVNHFEERFNKRYLPVWGSTETTGIAVANRPHYDYRPGSIGKSCINYDVRVVNSQGEEVADDEEGEMVVKGPAVMQGYFNLPSETESVLRNNWYYTGDIVQRDKDGFLYFLGRKTGMMKIGGMRVYPLEIVEAISAHPSVDEVAVVAERDSMRGEKPIAFVTLKKGESLSSGELKGFLRARLADYKIPRTIEFIKELPKTASGKIIKGELEKRDHKDDIKEISEEYFERLVDIDSKLVELLNERADAILKLRKVLEPRKHSIFYPDYEECLLRRVLEENKGPIYDESLEDIFDKIRSVIRIL